MGTRPVVLLDEPCVAGYTDKYKAIIELGLEKVALMSATLDSSFETSLTGFKRTVVESTRVLGGPLTLVYAGHALLPHCFGVKPDSIRRSTHLIRFYQSPKLLAQLDLPEELERRSLLTKDGIADIVLKNLPSMDIDWLPETTDLILTHFCGAQTMGGSNLVLTERDFYRESVVPILGQAESLRRRLKCCDEHEPLWPLDCCLNSAEHKERFKTENMLKMPMQISSDILGTSTAWAVTSALCGVLPLSGHVDRSFRFMAFALADKRSQTYAVGNRNLMFGTNLPLDSVVLDFNYALTPSECVQIAGRAGRLGKSSQRTSALFLYRLDHVRAMFG